MDSKLNIQREKEAGLENICQVLFESAAEGLIVLDKKGTIRMFNPRIEEMFGYTTNELTGQKVEILIPQQYRNKHISLRNEYNKNPRKRTMGIDMDLSAIRKDGTAFPVEISLNHFDLDDMKFVMALITDITERKKIRDNLEQLNKELESRVEERTQELSKAISALRYSNEDLQEEIRSRTLAEKKTKRALEKEKELNKLKSRFVSIASHEFRTPLGTILSSVALISKYNQPAVEDKRNKHIERIRSSVRNLVSILNDFLSLDKLEEGIIEKKPVSFDLIEFAEDIVEEMQAVAKTKQHIVYKHSGNNREVYLDKQLLKNIINNLLSNAIKYSAEGKRIDFTTQYKNAHLTISVKDRGIGIPDTDKIHMFERFFRARNSINIGGTGLGLNIVKKHVELMNGSVEFISKENEGTTFMVKLPLVTQQPEDLATKTRRH